MKTTTKIFSLVLVAVMVLTSAFATLPVSASTGSDSITLAAGQAPADVSDLKYVDGGKFLAWKDASGKIYSHTEKVTAAVDLTASYSIFHTASAALGTLNKAVPRDVTLIGPVVTTEGNVVFNRYTAPAGVATSAAGTQVHTNIGDYIAPKYSETPYVAYKYRTSISSNWMTSFAPHNYGVTTDICWTQPVSGITADGQWHLAVHKPSSFGGTAEAPLVAFRIAPYNAANGVIMKSGEYLDIEYIGFFESEAHAKAFDFNAYKEGLKIPYKVKIDGKEVTVGSYMLGSAVTLPAVDVPEDKILVGYKNSAGAVVTEGVVTTEILEYTSVYRNLPKGDYINERGNLANLKAKLDAGKLNVSFLGGSVTVGAGSSGRGRWGSRVIDYLRAEYPDAEINELNVGIGGTGSRLGSFRLADDVIAQDPDLVFVEFLVNDGYNGDYAGNVYDGKYYEYIIRTIRKKLPDAEIISVFTTDNGKAQNYGYGTMHPIGVEQDKIAAKYNATSIDVGRYMLESIFDYDKQFDSTIWSTYVTDTVHPGNLGYAAYAEVINKYLAGIKTATGETTTYTVPDSYVYSGASDYLPVVIPLTYDGTTINPELKNVTGFRLAGDSTSPAYSKKLVPSSNASFEFEFTGTELSLYMNSPNNSATITVTVDGVSKSQAGQADTNGPKEFFKGLENKKHTAKVELTGVNSNGNILGILVGGIVSYGDFNEDGAIAAADYVLLSRLVAGWENYKDALVTSQADFDGDGALTTVDSVILARHIAGWVGYENLDFSQND